MNQSKYFYTDYAVHSLRFYARYPNIEIFKTDVDKINWNTARDVIQSMDKKERDIILSLFEIKDIHIADAVTEVCEKYRIPVKEVRRLKEKCTLDFAKKRGLI